SVPVQSCRAIRGDHFMHSILPDLALERWRATRDALQAYAEVLSAIRRTLAPREKHWWHVSLQVAAAGLTTGPMPAGDRVIELLLDLLEHRLVLTTNRGERAAIELRGQNAAAFADTVLAALGRVHVAPALERAAFANLKAGAYDRDAVARFWQVLPRVDAALKRLKSEHRGESGAVQFWPHHFDVALLLFSGRRVPG